ncbi:MAG: hypothetical protein HY680_08635 [Chloroflexi bacterium]|nr:hypothetical protein [Chloroflexota bacterium]
MNERDEIKKLMQRVRRTRALPSSVNVVKETFERLGYTSPGVNSEEVLPRFNEMLRKAWLETLRTLEKYEQGSYAEGIPEEFIRAYPNELATAEQTALQQGFDAGVVVLFKGWYPRLRRAFLSVSQGRMARGGKDFELQIETLLSLAEVPFYSQERKERTDLILPNLETHQINRTISVVVSVKRTLRERWAEVAEELFNLRSPNVFLFTADDSISDDKVRRICGQYNIHLVVWDEVKEKRFPDQPLVLGYTEWAVKRLDVLRQRWK